MQRSLSASYLWKRQQQQHHQQGCYFFSTSRSAQDAIMAPRSSLYDVMELPVTASNRDIKRRFYELSKMYHPDRNRDKPIMEKEASQKKFLAVNEAYSVLGDYQKRAAYDRHHQQHRPHPFRTSPTSGSDYYRARANRYNRTRGKYYGPPPGYNNTRASQDSGPTRAHNTSSSSSTWSYYETVNPRSPFRDDSSAGHFDPHRHFLVHQRVERRHQATTQRRQQMRSDAESHGSDTGWRMGTMCVIFGVIAAFGWGAKSH